MDHEEIVELIPGYIDQELGLSDSLIVERHLQSCEECQREAREQSTVNALLKKDATYFDAPAYLAKRIDTLLPKDSARSRWSKYWNVNWLNAGAVMATVFAAAWSIGLYLSVPSNQERLTEEVIASHVRSLQVDHLSDVTSSDQHTVKPWFNGKLNFAPPVADLAPHGFPLVGGRLDYINSRPVAVLIYRHNQHPINLYVWPSSNKDAAPQAGERQGYHLLRWSLDGMEYWAVSDVTANDLRRFAELVRAAVRG